MSIDARMTRCPRPFEPELGSEVADLFPDLSQSLKELILGAGGCSPYLKGLMTREADWLPGALDDPEGAVQAEFDDLRETAPDKLPDALRRAKRRIALLTGLADLSGAWALEEVTGTLTRFGDLATQLALEATVGAEIRRGKLPGATEGDAKTAGGMVSLAMGKMGAFELNYSSDIDLIMLFDETRYYRDDFHDARASLVRATRKMTAMLSDNTAEGYVFRTDLRLRPDPAVTPVCMAMAAAETYYESLGRTWERAAYIKARPSAGDLDAGARFLKTLRPFVWRKHLDFAAIQDAHDMRLRIREHKGLAGPITLPGHNMKLGRGGIREIEFFTQTRQLIAGGRDPELRMRGTVEGLRALAAKGWVPADHADTLISHYRFHREVEHRVQMVGDAQTHDLPKSAENMERLAAFMGRDRADLERELVDRLTEVHALTEGFFAPDAAAPVPEAAAELDRDVVSRWRGYPCLRSSRAVEIFDRLKPEILGRLAKTDNPSEALLAFDGFLAGLPAGVQLFSLFDANPQLIDLLIDIVGTAPALGQHLSRNAQVFDAVIGGDFFADWPGRDALQLELADRLEAEPDYERKLDLTRRWGKEWHFRVGVHLLRGVIDADTAGQHYADLASAMLGALFPAVTDQFATKHGTPPGRGAVVLGMGSLGAERLSATSDLDLIVIYDPEGEDMSDGRRPLNSRTYYSRLTQALVTAMTAPMSEGRLYEVDMRLRPSGNQGPVATSWPSFQDYQQNEAWVWEHLALTRARPVAGATALAADVERFRCGIVAGPHDRDKVLREVAEMRARIAAAKAPAGPWDAKIGAGRMQDVELFAQAGLLLSGTASHRIPDGVTAMCDLGLIDAAARDALIAAYGLLWRVQVVSKLLTDAALDPDTIGQGAQALLLRVTGCDSVDALGSALTDHAAQAAAAITGALPEVEAT